MDDNQKNEELESLISNDNGTVVIGEGVNLEGKIDNAKDTNISGTYNGSINSDSLYVSKNGELKGDVKTEDITINGKFTGDIRSEKTLVINNTGSVKGNLEYSSLEVKFGGIIEGMVKHSASLSSFARTNEKSNQDDVSILENQILDKDSEDKN